MNENILKQIKVLPTLPQSVTKVNLICADPESSLADLAKVVKEDPVATGLLLKIANSSLYGSRNIKTVEMAVGMFGKAVTKSYVMSSAIAKSFKLDFTPYGMSPDDFSKVSQLRTQLMYKWYNQVNKSMLDTLTTAAQLGNLGQILISQDVIQSGKIDDFKTEIEDEERLETIELNMAGYTTIEVTAMILEHWKLDPQLIESIKASASIDSIEDASEDVKPFALALYIIYNAIDELGNFMVVDDAEELFDLMSDYNLDESLFTEVFEELKALAESDV
jgi:HD-like signal output (HDOD) protein